MFGFGEIMTNRYEVLNKVIRGRRSIRRFNDRLIRLSDLKRVIDAAKWAPCPNNYQSWKFIIAMRKSKTNTAVARYVEKMSKKKNIAISIFLNDAIHVLKSAGAVIYVFNTGIMKQRYKKMVSPYYQKKASLFEEQSISAAIENMLLFAETLDIGSVWLGSPVLVSKGIENIFDSTYELSAIIALGYYDSKPKKTKRLPLKEIVEIAD